MRSHARSLLLCSQLLVALAHPASGEPLLQAPYIAFSLGTGASRAALADLNADGFPDIVATNNDSNTISVRLGVGSAVFGARRVFPAGSEPLALALADVNGDGAIDAVTTHYPNGIALMLGDGHGAFGSPEPFPTAGYAPPTVRVGDWSGDGHPDLAVACRSAITILRGDGKGRFDGRIDLRRNAYTLGLRDLNHDGRADLVANDSTIAHILLSNGDGTFENAPDLTLPSEPSAMELADLDNDGNLDVGFACSDAGIVSLFEGRGDGAFGARRDVPFSSYPGDLTFEDMNGDHVLDLVASSFAPSKAGFALGRGDGSFGERIEYPTNDLTVSIMAADVNDDGRMDLATTTMYTVAVAVLLQNADHSFAFRLTTFETPPATGELIGRDIDADGVLDLALISFDSVALLRGHGDGSFEPPSNHQLPSATDLEFADLNGDALPDLVVTRRLADVVSVLLQQAGGVFGPGTDYSVGREPVQVTIGDVNSDSRLDLLVANRLSPFSILLGNGDGTFAAKFDRGRPADAVTLADLNSDGKLDLVYASRPDLLFARLGLGGAFFGIEYSYPVAPEPKQLLVADLNRDGRPDAVTNSRGNLVSARMGNGDGTFGERLDFEVGVDPVDIALADLDLDGRLDLASACYTSKVVTILMGREQGVFGDRLDYGMGGTPVSIAVGAFDANASPDIAASNAYRTAGTLLSNQDRRTPVGVSDLRAERLDTGVRVSWRLAPEMVSRIGDLRLQRSYAPTGEYIDCGMRLPLEPVMSYDDLDASVNLESWYRLVWFDDDGSEHLGGPIGIEPGVARGPAIKLGWGPDGRVDIRYEIPRTSSDIRLAVFDARGRQVRMLDRGARASGSHLCSWDRRNNAGSTVAHGVYWVQLRADGRQVTRKLIVRR